MWISSNKDIISTYLIDLCGLQEDCNVCSKETSKLIMQNSSVPNLLYLPTQEHLNQSHAKPLTTLPPHFGQYYVIIQQGTNISCAWR